MTFSLMNTRGLCYSIFMPDAVEAGYHKLIVELGAVAHHAGYLMRTYWDQAHCARGVRGISSIGQDVHRPPFGQGVDMLPIWQ